MDKEEETAIKRLSPSSIKVLPFTLMMIHGAGHSAGLWREQIVGLADRIDTLAVDLPGHGDRRKESGRESIAAYADWIIDSIKRNDLKRVVLCGHSMGGAIVQHLLILHPRSFTAGILVNSGARLRVKPEFLSGINQNYAQFVDQLFFYGFAEANQTPTMKAAFQRDCACDPRTAWGDFTACNEFDVMEQVGAIRRPTLVIASAQDRMTPIKYGDFLSQHIPGARLCAISGAGHYAPMEQPSAVNHAIIEFLESLA